VSWNARVAQVDNEPVSLSISEYKSLVGDCAVASKPLKGLAQCWRRCHEVIKQPDFARIVIACQREAKAIILQLERRIFYRVLGRVILLRLCRRFRNVAKARRRRARPTSDSNFLKLPPGSKVRLLILPPKRGRCHLGSDKQMFGAE
jgi:hypothetical protein